MTFILTLNIFKQLSNMIQHQNESMYRLTETLWDNSSHQPYTQPVCIAGGGMGAGWEGYSSPWYISPVYVVHITRQCQVVLYT